MPESTRHREAFDLYWELGADRSIERLQVALKARGRSPTLRTLYEWSRAYRWQDRIADLEREARARARESQLQALSEMNERHRKEGLALQQKALERIAALSPRTMSAAEAIRGLIEGVRLERLGAGAPTERIHQDGGLNDEDEFRQFTIEELRRLAAVAEAHATGAGEEEPEQPA